MPEIIEKSLDVGVKHVAQTSAMESKEGLKRLVGVAVLNVGEGRWMKQGFEDGSQKAANHLLGHSIPDGRNAEGTKLRIILGNEDPTKGFGLKRTLFKVLHQSLEIVLKIGLKHLDANLVDTCGPTVAFDRFEGGQDQLWGNSSGERVNFLFGHSRFPISINNCEERKPALLGTVS
jgi:hypothetical protein